MMKQYEQEKEATRNREKQNRDQIQARQSLTAEELQRLEEAKKNLSQKFKSGNNLSQTDLDANTRNSDTSYKTTYRITLNKSRMPPNILPKSGRDGASYSKPVALGPISSQDVDISSGSETVRESGKKNELVVKTPQIHSVRDAIFAFEHPVSGDGQVTPEKSKKNFFRIKGCKSSFSSASSFDSRSSVTEENNITTSDTPNCQERDLKAVNLCLPEIVLALHVIPKEVTLYRRQSGDFGFTLRKGTVKHTDDGKETLKTIVFAEPGDRNVGCGLMPGDRLIELNGLNVESHSRDEIIELIKHAGSSLKLRVQPSKEMTELRFRPGSEAINRSDEKLSHRLLTEPTQAKAEDQVMDVDWLTAERVWLVHKGGFAAARVAKRNETMQPGHASDGKCRIRLEHGGEVLDVDEENVEKTNPPTFDRTEDLVTLRHLNESSILHVLRQRYASNLVHTNAGHSTLIIINPMHPLSIYADKVIHMFKEHKMEDVPPHIYAVARSALQSLVNTRKNQSIVLMGRSGSGKTTNAKHLLTYYAATAADSTSSQVTVEKLNACFALLDAFGNSRTTLNTNTSNFTQISLANFNSGGQLISLSFQILLLERSRLTRRPKGEPTFSVFYQMLSGINSNLRKQLHLEDLTEHCQFMTPLQRPEDHQTAVKSWSVIDGAFTTLTIAEHEKVAIYSILAAIYHLGVAGTVKGQNGNFQFVNLIYGQHAAEILGLSVDELLRAIFDGKLQKARYFPTHRDESDSDALSAIEDLERFVIDLYFETFQTLIALMNRAVSSGTPTTASVLVFDCPGFRNPASCNRNAGATLDDLFHNYLNERLQLLYYETLVVAERDLYAEENIDCDIGMDLTLGNESRYSVVNLMEGLSLPASILASCQEKSKGLLQLLEEEASSGSSDDSFLQMLFESRLVQRGLSSGSFVIHHFQGANAVQYDVRLWLHMFRNASLSRPNVSEVLLHSKKSNIQSLFCGHGVGRVDSLRFAGSLGMMFASAVTNVRRRGLSHQIKLQIDTVIDVLQKTHLHFVRCFLPQPDAGLSELRLASTPSFQESRSSSFDDLVFCVPLIRSELRSAEILPVIRLCRQGYPEHVSFQEFLRRYEILIPSSERSTETSLTLKQNVSHLMEMLDCDKSSFKIGETKVFLRGGTLAKLNVKIEDRLSNWIVLLQTICRRHLARKKQQKLKLQHLAASCLQRNIRKLMGVSEWPWWRLYTKVKPLLDIHRTETELRDSQLELEQLKLKLEKAEEERMIFKQSSEILEAKLSEMKTDMQEEHLASRQVVEILEKEKSQRIRIEKELQDACAKVLHLQSLNQKTEMELTDARMLLSSSGGHANDVDYDDDDDSDDEHQQKLVRMRCDADFARKKLQQQYVEEIEQLETSKRQIEKRLNEANAVREEQNQTIHITRRKCERLNQEMADLRLHLEEQCSRNLELEKRQRKFDVELQKVADSLQAEKSTNEKVQRERNDAVNQKFTLEKEMKELKSELDIRLQKIAVLEKELDEMTATDKGDQEILRLKQLKIKLEAKMAEQEEELDEQAGVIQQLEQGKLKLEITQERMRQQHLKELEERDQELENVKSSLQRKLKAVEVDLEEKHQERQKMIQEKRSLEHQIQFLTEQTTMNKPDAERNLRLTLKRTKVLLKDAQLALDRQKEGNSGRSVIKQLRNQLDDAEFALGGAVKAKVAAEMEINDLRQQLDDMTKAKHESDQKCHQLLHSNSKLQTQCEEHEDDISELMKKYKASVQQNSIEQMGFQSQSGQLEAMKLENQKLREELMMTQSKLNCLHSSTVDREVASRLEAKIGDLEMRLGLEQTVKCRAEAQVARLKEQLEKEMEEKQNWNLNRSRSEDGSKRLERRVRELEQELNAALRRETDSNQKKLDLEKKMECVVADFEHSQGDLQLALRRIDDLHAALEDPVELYSDAESDDGSLDEVSDDLDFDA